VVIEPRHGQLLRWQVVVLGARQSGDPPAALMPAEVEFYHTPQEIMRQQLHLAERDMLQARPRPLAPRGAHACVAPRCAPRMQACPTHAAMLRPHARPKPRPRARSRPHEQAGLPSEEIDRRLAVLAAQEPSPEFTTVPPLPRPLPGLTIKMHSPPRLSLKVRPRPPLALRRRRR
jgi:hypothetical protein